jgi:hypothetical protein
MRRSDQRVGRTAIGGVKSANCSNGAGVVFTFQAVTGGGNPYGTLLLTPAGTLYGTSASDTCTNCGVIWQYTP